MTASLGAGPQYSAFLTPTPGQACQAEERPGLRFKSRGEGPPREDAESALWGTALLVTSCQSCSVVMLASLTNRNPATRGEGASPVLCPHPAYFLNPLETLTCLKPAAERLATLCTRRGLEPRGITAGRGHLDYANPYNTRHGRGTARCILWPVSGVCVLPTPLRSSQFCISSRHLTVV